MDNKSSFMVRPDPRAEKLEENREHKEYLFASLFSGKESQKCKEMRWFAYKAALGRTKRFIEGITTDVHQDVVEKVTTFVSLEPQESDKVPLALVVGGSNLASQSHFFSLLSQKFEEEICGVIINLSSDDSLNIKTLLRRINQDILWYSEKDTEKSFLTTERKLLYDPRIIQRWCKANLGK